MVQKQFFWKKWDLARRIRERWVGTDEEIRKNIVSILNYGINAFLLAIPTTIMLGFITPFETGLISTFFFAWMCLWVLIPYIEYYFIWFKEGWKN